MEGGYVQGAMDMIKAMKESAAVIRHHGDEHGAHTLERQAEILETRLDQEPTPPAGTVMCQTCGQPRQV